MYVLYLSALTALQNDHSWSKHRVSWPWVSTPSEQAIPNTARYLDTAFYILTFYAFVLYMYFILNNFVLHIDYLF